MTSRRFEGKNVDRHRRRPGDRARDRRTVRRRGRRRDADRPPAGAARGSSCGRDRGGRGHAPGCTRPTSATPPPSTRAVAAAHGALGAHRRARQQRGYRRGEAVPRDRGRELGPRSRDEPSRRVPDGAARRPRAGRGGRRVDRPHRLDRRAPAATAPTRATTPRRPVCSGSNRTMALELGPHGVRVNCVSPGFTHTEMTEVGVPPGMMDYLVHRFDRVPLRRLVRPGGDRRRLRVPRLRRRLGDHRASTSRSTVA